MYVLQSDHWIYSKHKWYKRDSFFPSHFANCMIYQTAQKTNYKRTIHQRTCLRPACNCSNCQKYKSISISDCSCHTAQKKHHQSRNRRCRIPDCGMGRKNSIPDESYYRQYRQLGDRYLLCLNILPSCRKQHCQQKRCFNWSHSFSPFPSDFCSFPSDFCSLPSDVHSSFCPQLLHGGKDTSFRGTFRIFLVSAGQVILV